MEKCRHNKSGICNIGDMGKPDFCDCLCEDCEPLSSDAVLAEVRADVNECISLYLNYKTGHGLLDKLRIIEQKISEHFR